MSFLFQLFTSPTPNDLPYNISKPYVIDLVGRFLILQPWNLNIQAPLHGSESSNDDHLINE